LYTNLPKQNEPNNLEFLILRKESTKRIFKEQSYETLRFGFGNRPAWIRKDSWGFIEFVKTGQIFGSSGHESGPLFKSLIANPDLQICEVGFVNHETKWIFLESGFVTTIQNESMDSWNESTFLQISYTIPASL